MAALSSVALGKISNTPRYKNLIGKIDIENYNILDFASENVRKSANSTDTKVRAKALSNAGDAFGKALGKDLIEGISNANPEGILQEGVRTLLKTLDGELDFIINATVIPKKEIDR